MDEAREGFVFDIQRYTLHDGPGIRTEVFLQGCHLRCLWCHSPDSWTEQGELAGFRMLCSGVDACGECLKVCPTGALSPAEPSLSKRTRETIRLVDLDRTRCTQCGECARVCANKALYFTARTMTVADVLEVIAKDDRYYRKTGGGVTISGGEPMLQSAFAGAIFRQCKALGLHTALDTTGNVAWEHYESLLDAVDLVLFDLKHMDPEVSQRLTGVRNGLILENLAKMAARGTAIQIRMPVIPGCNDDPANLEATADCCRSLGPALTLVQLLPYHRLGMPKYERVGKIYALPEVVPPSREAMESYKALFASRGLPVRIG